MTFIEHYFGSPNKHGLLLVDGNRLFFSLTSLLASIASLFICMWASLPWPWLALMLGYITAQSLPGTGRAKLFHRLGGVLAGAVAALAVVPNLQNSPVLLVLAMSIWTGGFMFLAVRDRGPRAAFYQLSAFSGAIIAFPNVDNPVSIFLTAVDRVEEMAIGIVMMTVAHILLRPWSAVPMARQRARTFLADAAAWTISALGERRTELAQEQRRKLAADVTELGIISTHLPGRRVGGVPLPHLARTLQAELASILPCASAVADRYDLLHQRGPLPPEIETLIHDVRLWLREGRPDEADRLEARCAALAARWSEAGDWDALLAANLCQRIGDLVAAYHDAQRGLAAFCGEARPVTGQRATVRRMKPARDLTVPVMAGLGTAAALSMLCLFWISTAWPSGAATGVFATLMGTSFNTADDPAPVLGRYIRTLVLSLPLGIFYLAVLLPAVDSFVMLAAMLAPALLVLGYLQASPKHAAVAFPILSGFIVATFLTARYHYDFAVVVNTWLGQIGGATAALVAAKLFRSVSVTWVTERMVRRQWREIEQLTTAPPGRFDTARWAVHAIDRLGQIAARLAATPAGHALHAVDGLVDMRIGQEVLRIRAVRDAGSEAACASIRHLLDGLGQLYRARRRSGSAVAPPASLLATIDTTLVALRSIPDRQLRDDALIATAGLRCDLLPSGAAHPAPLLLDAA